MIASTQQILTRHRIEQVLMRAEYLDQPDRALLDQVLARNVRPRQIAAVTGCTARCVQRRVRRLVLHLTDPAVLHILRNHRKWEASTGRVALCVLVQRRTLRDTAGELNLSLHEVRQCVQKVKGLLEAAGLANTN